TRRAKLSQLVHCLGLACLQVAEEVPAERVAVARMLRLEVLRAVFSHDVDACVREHLQLLDRDVLRRHDDRDARTDLFLDARVVLAHALRRQGRSRRASLEAYPSDAPS